MSSGLSFGLGGLCLCYWEERGGGYSGGKSVVLCFWDGTGAEMSEKERGREIREEREGERDK